MVRTVPTWCRGVKPTFRKALRAGARHLQEETLSQGELVLLDESVEEDGAFRLDQLGLSPGSGGNQEGGRPAWTFVSILHREMDEETGPRRAPPHIGHDRLADGGVGDGPAEDRKQNRLGAVARAKRRIVVAQSGARVVRPDGLFDQEQLSHQIAAGKPFRKGGEGRGAPGLATREMMQGQ